MSIAGSYAAAQGQAAGGASNPRPIGSPRTQTIPPAYAPSYQGPETMVQLRADYTGSLIALRDVDPDSMFTKGSYNVPRNLTRSWGTEEERIGEGHKRLTGPIEHLCVSVGYMPLFANPDGAFLGAPDNHAASQAIADCFTKDLMIAVRAVVDKYNAAVAEIASEGKLPSYVAVKTKSTMRDAPGADTWQMVEASLRAGKHAQEAVAHCSRHPCHPIVSVEHGNGCSSTARRQSLAATPGQFPETDTEGSVASDHTAKPGETFVIPGRGHVRVKKGKRGSQSPDI